jgi:hypothetical protein
MISITMLQPGQAKTFCQAAIWTSFGKPKISQAPMSFTMIWGKHKLTIFKYRNADQNRMRVIGDHPLDHMVQIMARPISIQG